LCVAGDDPSGMLNTGTVKGMLPSDGCKSEVFALNVVQPANSDFCAVPASLVANAMIAR
jgi:hypothetical protein